MNRRLPLLPSVLQPSSLRPPRPLRLAPRASLASAALFLLACSKAAPPPPPASPPASPPAVPATVSAAAGSVEGAAGQSEDCTLQTPLTPGIPGSPGHLIPSQRNPNGQSELAALMRAMEATLKEARDQIGRGQPVGPFLPKFRRMRCAWPTNPGDRDAQFDALATAYLSAVSQLDAARDSGAAAKAYSGVLQGCRSCHERACSGALAAISALQLP